MDTDHKLQAAYTALNALQGVAVLALVFFAASGKRGAVWALIYGGVAVNVCIVAVFFGPARAFAWATQDWRMAVGSWLGPALLAVAVGSLIRFAILRRKGRAKATA
jgi:hypothetical protein